MSVKRPELTYRGISVPTLVESVKTTAPYLFQDDRYQTLPFAQELRRVAALPVAEQEALQKDLWSYFDVCLFSHFATVGTFVPTDVDLAIRQKLWNFVHHEQAFLPMWETIKAMATWDESAVSKRFVFTEGHAGDAKEKLSGHQGEWFTVAMGAYGSAKKIARDHLQEVRESIESEVDRQERVLSTLEKTFLDDPNGDRLRAYCAGVSAVIHNLGDLDRMFEAWEIPDEDVLKRRVFRCGHEDARSPRQVFQRAGVVYQTMLASENHRHFALREPKPLRQSPQFLLTYGPFLDSWGEGLVNDGFHPGIFTERDLRDIAVALIEGWKKLNLKTIYHSQGYSRALCGIAVGLGKGDFAKGRPELDALVPPVIRRELQEGGLRTLMNVSRAQFENSIMKKMLKILESVEAGEND